MVEDNLKVFKGNIIFTRTKDDFTIYEHGYVVVKDGVILFSGNNLPENYKNYPITDYKDMIIIPAFNDLHIHAPQFRNRGLCLDITLIDWLFKCTFPEEGKFKNIDYARYVYALTIKALWNAGNLRSLIYNTVFKDSTMLLLDMLIESGLGGYVGKVNMDIEAPIYLLEDTDKSLIDTEDILKKYLNKSPLVKPIITPRFIPSCSPQLLTGLGMLSKKYNASVMSHLSEDLEEIKIVKKMYPEFPNYASIYDYYGLLGSTPTVMAHCVFSPDSEVELLKKNNVLVAHSPSSNCNLGSGMMGLRRFLNAGLKVGLGCDVSGGGDISLLYVMSYAMSVSKMINVYNTNKYESIKSHEAFYLATKSGGSFFGNVGSFEPGYDFDALVIDDSPLMLFDYNLKERIERIIYLDSSRYIVERFVKGNKIPEPKFQGLYIEEEER